MKFIPPLTPAQKCALQELHKSGPAHRERQRAQAVLLSSRGYKIDQLADLFECDRDTISQWLDAFLGGGAAALGDAPRPGRPPKIEGAALEVVREAVEHPTPNLKATLLDTLKKTVFA